MSLCLKRQQKMIWNKKSMIEKEQCLERYCLSLDKSDDG